MKKYNFAIIGVTLLLSLMIGWILILLIRYQARNCLKVEMDSEMR